MIAVISDLHFEEEASDVISGGSKQIIFRRNLDPKAYRSFISHMADEARRRYVENFELVIAGDVFDLNRTTLWFNDELRPYVSLDDVSPELEKKVLKILEAVAAEPAVSQTLALFRNLAAGKYKGHDSTARDWVDRDFPCPVKITCLTGNHDRLANGSAAIRKRVCELMGIREIERFPHYALFEDPDVLVRHGHEYDNNNFALDLPGNEPIPLKVDEAGYSQANFGDFITIDVAVRLPYLFRHKYGDEQILKDPVLGALYLRLLQFDDVRPQSALLDYMLDDSEGNFSVEEAWERFVPMMQDLMAQIHDDKFFRYWLGRRAKPWAPAELELARGLLQMGGWHNRPAREAARKITRFMMGGEPDQPQLSAMREELVVQNKVRVVLSGHTHSPDVCLIKNDETGDRFYINTGTWRDVIPSTPDGRTFGRMRALTYVTLYSKAEQSESCNSFDYWTGFTKDW
ncbi:MAG TPA: metallophosphoesterase family protein [Terriglobales bacterium]|jgi:UDP-2,3-diacylglucosamine pyrophosphatase LpxH|nr:metallophosphoesterase family protein [Terriglobales bacterium]